MKKITPEDIKAYLNLKQFMETGLKEYLQNESIPLDERWDVFVEASDAGLLAYLPWIWHPNFEKKLGLKEISWYDDFYVERYVDFDFTTMIERIEDEFKYNEEDEKVIVGITREMIPVIKEEMLSTGARGFNYDW